MLYLALIIPRLFRENAFLRVRYLYDAFYGQKLRGVCHFRGDPYGNSTAILFLIQSLNKILMVLHVTGMLIY